MVQFILLTTFRLSIQALLPERFKRRLFGVNDGRIENGKIDVCRADQQAQLRAAENDALRAVAAKILNDAQKMVL